MNNTITLRCLDAEAAENVAAQFPGRGNSANTLKVVGAGIVIEYFDKRWPYDIASWAFDEGLTSDSAAAFVISRL